MKPDLKERLAQFLIEEDMLWQVEDTEDVRYVASEIIDWMCKEYREVEEALESGG